MNTYDENMNTYEYFKIDFPS